VNPTEAEKEKKEKEKSVSQSGGDLGMSEPFVEIEFETFLCPFADLCRGI